MAEQPRNAQEWASSYAERAQQQRAAAAPPSAETAHPLYWFSNPAWPRHAPHPSLLLPGAEHHERVGLEQVHGRLAAAEAEAARRAAPHPLVVGPLAAIPIRSAKKRDTSKESEKGFT